MVGGAGQEGGQAVQRLPMIRISILRLKHVCDLWALRKDRPTNDKNLNSEIETG